MDFTKALKLAQEAFVDRESMKIHPLKNTHVNDVPVIAASLIVAATKEEHDLNKQLLDTVYACLVAAGASEDVDIQEQQVNAAGTKPSHFIKQQMEKL